jgi:competence protein ComEC
VQRIGDVRLAELFRKAGSGAAGMMLAQRGQLFHWVPVFMGIGIGGYFALKVEPALWILGSALLLAMICAGLAMRTSAVVQPLLLALALALAGGGLAGTRAQSVGAPVLGWRYYGPVEGRVVEIDRSASDAVRLTLDRVHLDRLAPEKTPARVRISLHGPTGTDPLPGMVVMTTAHLSPPGGPVEPGGFDFQRHAWFQRLGAVGYAQVPLMALERPEPADLRIFRWRMALSARFQSGLPGEAGAFAAAVTAGDRSGMGQETLRDLRVSNLAHLLAISGLHMGLLTGFVFAAIRTGLSLSRHASLFWPVKIIAAMAALMAATGYLMLSGGSIATERAFVMVAVALVAVMAQRRAISLRAVALAAVLVLLLRPEALLSPGFQMSFAATLALVVVFGVMRDRQWRLTGWWGHIAAVILSSAVAGAATAPVAAAQFNQLAHYGLLANLLSVPVMGVLVIPSAVVAVLAMPLALEALPLWGMGLGLKWILWVAHWVAGLDGARSMVPSPPSVVLPMLTLGALVMALWSGRGRWCGGLPVMLAMVLWVQVQRPLVVIAESGGLVGVMTEQGRALSRDKAQSFVASIWLENDGDPATQELAAQRWPLIDGMEVRHFTGVRAAAQAGPCAPGGILVLNVAAKQAPMATGCRIFDPDSLRRSGAVALWRDGTAMRVVTAQEVRGKRFWTQPDIHDSLEVRLQDLMRRFKLPEPSRSDLDTLALARSSYEGADQTDASQ